MRKIIVIFSVFALLTTLNSCQKNGAENTKGTSSSHQPDKYQPYGGPMTVGQKHNTVLDDYIAEYGFFNDDGTTRDGVEIMVNKVAIIQASYNWLNTSAAVAAEDIMSELDNLGIFNPDGTSKSQDQINEILVNQETNAALKVVMTNITEYTGNPDNFMDYADAQFASLTALTGDDLTRAQGAHDVLGNSHEKYKTMGAMFDQLTAAEKINALAAADAAGALYGAKFAVANGHWSPVAWSNDVAYFSIGFSVKAAQM
jgi:hypothetical protein